MDSYSLKNAAAIVSPGQGTEPKALSVKGGRLRILSRSGKASIDLGGSSFVYPAMINTHDHLRGNYLPRVGPKGDNYYINWGPWDNDLKASDIFEERSALTVEQMYFLGAYKNLFSGVATVNDHFPHEYAEPFIPRLPIRVIREYGLAHECSSFDLKWGNGIEAEHAIAVEKGWPFITHLEEGYDVESMDGVGILQRLKCLDGQDLLVHCIGFSDKDIAASKKAGVSISWCPASNIFMFNTTCKIRKFLRGGVNVALGTDSTHTGSINLMAEMKYAREAYQAMYGEELPATTLFNMVTINAAKAFKMEATTGSLEDGKRADILVLAAKDGDPYENLAKAKPEDIEFLSIDGVPVLCEERFSDLVPEGQPYGKVRIGGRAMLVRGDPAGLYAGVRAAVGFAKKLDYLPFEP